MNKIIATSAVTCTEHKEVHMELITYRW